MIHKIQVESYFFQWMGFILEEKLKELKGDMKQWNKHVLVEYECEG